MFSGAVPTLTPRSAGSAFLLAGVLAVLFLAGCKGDEGGQSTLPPNDELETPAEYTDRGWERFEAGNFSGSLSDFNAAIFLEPTYGEANTGQGWARLVQATSPNSMRGLVGAFDSAVDNGETGADVFAGRAAGNLGSGSPFLDAAVADAQAALAADAGFVFAHRPSFNVQDLHLVTAFAQAGKGNFSAALTAADLVLDSGIEEENPGTWVVGGTTYDSFLGAVMARLHQLSEDFSG